jgi:hypothetical protein
MDVHMWTKEMNQGMNSIISYEDERDSLVRGKKMVDGRHVFYRV